MPDRHFYVSGGGSVTIEPVIRISAVTGNEYSVGCGTMRGLIGCSTYEAPGARLAGDEHPRKVIPNSCGDPACPVCWKTWAKRESHRQASGVRAYGTYAAGQMTLSGDQAGPRQARHVTVSMPASLKNRIHEKTLAKIEKNGGNYDYYYIDIYRREERKLFELSGFDGVKTIFHPFRIKKKYKNHVSAAANYFGINRYDWIKKQKDWRRFVYFSPHSHWVAYGTHIPDFYEKSEGCVLKVIRDVYDEQGLFFYLLSHCGAIKGRNAVTGWGCLSKRRLPIINREIEKLETYCEVCGANMVYMDVGADDTITPTDRHVYRKVPIYTHRVKSDTYKPLAEIRIRILPIDVLPPEYQELLYNENLDPPPPDCCSRAAMVAEDLEQERWTKYHTLVRLVG